MVSSVGLERRLDDDATIASLEAAKRARNADERIADKLVELRFQPTAYSKTEVVQLVEVTVDRALRNALAVVGVNPRLIDFHLEVTGARIDGASEHREITGRRKLELRKAIQNALAPALDEFFRAHPVAARKLVQRQIVKSVSKDFSNILLDTRLNPSMVGNIVCHARRP